MATSQRNLSELNSKQFDVVIVGGGISGAWLALHCAQLGHRTALIEKDDYASQTSSASSKLLHGGIRYLQQMQFTKVRESAMERAHYLYAAPHLSTPVPFVVPTYHDFQRSKFFLNCGMIAYRILCFGENRIIESDNEILPPIRSISASELNQIYDLGTQMHTGAVVFHERHMIDSERMVLAILQTARDQGACIHNYVSCQEFLLSNNDVTGVKVQDELNGERFDVNCKLVINAAGPWIDNLNAALPRSESAFSIKAFAVGSHIVTRQLCDHAIALTTNQQSNSKLDRGGRHVFVIPWRGRSLIGTSYDELECANSEVKLQPEHVTQLLDAVNSGLPNAKLSRADVISGYSGLYPLQTNNSHGSVYQASGDYHLVDHAKVNGVSGLITALGAKYTTGRKLSELTMKLVAQKLGGAAVPKKIKFVSSAYQSNGVQNLSQFEKTKLEQYKGQLPADTIRHLVRNYGSELDAFIHSVNNDYKLRLRVSAHQPDIFGQVAWAIKHEQAVTLADVLFRRTSLALLGINEDEVRCLGRFMAPLLEWDDREQVKQIAGVLGWLSEIRNTLHDNAE